MEEKKNVLTLTEDEVNLILRYLGNRPYSEVYSLIGMIQQRWDEQNGK